MKSTYFLLLLISLISGARLAAQSDDSLRANTKWTAQWIGSADPTDNGLGYGVYYFRKTIQLEKAPKAFKIHVSADNHYKLYVNGRLVSVGPARGTLHSWKYETLDIAKELNAGENLVAAMVWNEGQWRPEAQFSLRTSFVLQGHSAKEEVLNTNESWKCIRDSAFQPILGYYAAINAQLVDMHKTIHHWQQKSLQDKNWPQARNLFPAQPKGLSDGFGYILIPSLLPAREMVYQPITEVRHVQGIKGVGKSLQLPFKVAPNSEVTVLLDQGEETNAFPTIVFSGGNEATIGLGYSEALYKKGSNFTIKGNRNQVEGMEFRGLTDSIISDGTEGQSFTPFYFRTYRYMRLRVKTGAAPLVIDKLYGTFTAYPFIAEAKFNSENKLIKKILDIGWHTARLNAYDVYFTGQYYERLQYIGDARIQALISYYYSHDDRLTRNAINQIDESRLGDGITLSRSPSRGTQVIPPFSLIYIGMLHDFMMYRDDPAFIKSKLSGEREILHFFSNYQGSDGSLVHPPFWNFTDWAKGAGWGFGTPPHSEDGGSSILDLQLLWGYLLAEQLEANYGLPYYVKLYQQKVSELKATIQKKYWDPARKLYADTREKTTFSQHANALAILTGVVQKADLMAFSKRLMTDSSLTKVSLYFAYYLNKALIKGGLGEHYLSWLKPWVASMNMGLTTWVEEPDLATTRSDCHAWSSSPNIEFYRTVLGIDSDAPGFKKVKIIPSLGELTQVSGEIPHPEGMIKVAYKKNKGQWHVQVELPGTLTGRFVWNGETRPLHTGKNVFTL